MQCPQSRARTADGFVGGPGSFMDFARSGGARTRVDVQRVVADAA